LYFWFIFELSTSGLVSANPIAGIIAVVIKKLAAVHFLKKDIISPSLSFVSSHSVQFKLNDFCLEVSSSIASQSSLASEDLFCLCQILSLYSPIPFLTSC
jgi:hypothetical protein